MNEAASLQWGPMAKKYDTESSGASVSGKLTCPEHGTPLICPTCNGVLGGSKTSEAKTTAARANASRKRPGAQGMMKPRKNLGQLQLERTFKHHGTEMKSFVVLTEDEELVAYAGPSKAKAETLAVSTLDQTKLIELGGLEGMLKVVENAYRRKANAG